MWDKAEEASGLGALAPVAESRPEQRPGLLAPTSSIDALAGNHPSKRCSVCAPED